MNEGTTIDKKIEIFLKELEKYSEDMEKLIMDNWKILYE